MSVIRRAEIKVYIDENWWGSKHFVGTEDEIYKEADDYMNEIILKFRTTYKSIYGKKKLNEFLDTAYHIIEWEDDSLTMFALYEENVKFPVHGVFPTREEAEVAARTIAEEWAKDVMEKQDPKDVLGYGEWDPEMDFDFLVNNALGCFEIQEVPVFGVCRED